MTDAPLQDPRFDPHHSFALSRMRDSRTRLPNREAYIRQRMQSESVRATVVLVTLADAQSFDEISSTLGHDLADKFLRAGAERLLEIIGSGTGLYHVSTLAFAFRLPGCCEPSPPPLIARILDGFRAPLIVDGIPVAATLGIGLRAGGGRGGNPAEDLRTALSAAQKSHAVASGWAWYDKGSDESRRRTYMILNELKSALASGNQLELHYQPKVWLATGACDNAEALVRWNHPLLGAVSPGEFVPLAEATTLVTPLTRWVIDAATRQVAAWRAQGLHMRVAINISPKNLTEPDFVDFLRFTCELRDVPPEMLELEVTEGVSADRGTAIAGRIAALREFGFGIAIDDFGSGYSNMAYLTELSAHTLKIDRSLVQGASPHDRRGRLVSGIIQMGRDLGYTIVAEGIETDAERGVLHDLGCELGQGWLFGRAMPPDAFLEWYRNLPARQRPSGAGKIGLARAS